MLIHKYHQQLYIVWCLLLIGRVVNDLLKNTQQNFVENVYMPSEHMQKLLFIQELDISL